LSMFIDEVVDQQRYILSSLPQWRKHDRYDIKTVEEVVVTEILPVHFFLKILIGCNDDSNVDFDRLVAAQGSNLVLLESSQHFGLKGLAGVANLIEQERAFMSFLKEALFIVNGTRQSAAHMSEKFALKQVSGREAQLTATKG